MTEVPNTVASNSLAAKFNAEIEDQVAASEALTQALVQTALDKKAAQASGNAVPNDKSAL